MVLISVIKMSCQDLAGFCCDLVTVQFIGYEISRRQISSGIFYCRISIHSGQGCNSDNLFCEVTLAVIERMNARVISAQFFGFIPRNKSWFGLFTVREKSCHPIVIVPP
jgi:hypothetical protein